MILYEYPFNERIRTYLRLEQLLRRLGEMMSREHPLDHHFAFATLFELIDVAGRADLKSDVMKDLERHKQLLVALRGNPAIAVQRLDEFIGELDHAYATLLAQPGRTGHDLNEHEWLTALRSRMAIPGGTCPFDLPAYHHWQHQPAPMRQQALRGWTQTLAPLAHALHMLLRLLRDSGQAQKVVTQQGQFQQNLPQGRSFQLLRLRMPASSDLIPEISGNRLLVSIRMLRHDAEGRVFACGEDTSFELTLCA